MVNTKRLRSESFYNFHENNDRKRFLPSTTNDNFTQFENLANELIYDIFDYLDFYHIYLSFFNLNFRFRSLLIDSTLPLNINLFLMSKTTFNQYNEDIIKPNQQRIDIFRVTNYYMFDKNTFLFSQMISLQTLILETVRSVQMKDIIQQLISLPNLSSLTISTINAVENIDFIYKRIFRLTSLRYCKLSLSRKFPKHVSPLTLNEYSPIEHLNIDHGIGFDELSTLLLYLPQLRHLSTCIWHKTDFILKPPCAVLNNLTYVSLKLYGCVTFNDLELFLVNYCTSIQFLCISGDKEFLNANRWKRLISSSLTNLQTFDIKCEIRFADNTAIKQEMKNFNSLFWIERQWFFECRAYSTKFYDEILFYSMNPFRRKEYRLSQGKSNKNRFQTNFNSVHHLTIEDNNGINESRYCFPHATMLTLAYKVSINDITIVNNLQRILSLKQIQILEILSDHICPLKMCQLLSYMPNVHTLKFRSMSFDGYGKKRFEENQLFRLISKINLIKSIHFYGKCTLQNLEIFLKLFPNLQYIETSVELQQIQLVLQYLLNQTNTNARHLKLLCFSCDGKESHYISKLIKSRLLPCDCKTMYDDQRLRLYIWW
ncbi:unnamed protein product [Adineta steineri]|uniref:F-box domain-containing protein n=1 Tax=Adineta steineri TaxID=433720 RepID=A0A815IUA6_9BILA|nr:unnamed protein product [Adineta steineri]